MCIPYIIANWKMNKTLEESEYYACALEEYLCQHEVNANVVICPPAVLFASFAKVRSSKYALGIQNFYPSDNGSFTGENSLSMVEAFGVSYAIIGHSERRKLFGEDNALIAKKLGYALHKGYTPILCIGETQQHKEQGITKACIEEQLQVLCSLDTSLQNPICIAYEPVWAIGTGIVPTEEEIATVVKEIAKYIRKNLDKSNENIYTLYGGSVSENNIQSILTIEGIHGVLIGNASLQLDSFIHILQRIQ